MGTFHSMDNLPIQNLEAEIDSPDLELPFDVSSEDNPARGDEKSILDLDDPSNLKEEIIYDPLTKSYFIVRKIGENLFRTPIVMDAESYQDYLFKRNEQNYFKEKSNAQAYLERRRKQKYKYLNDKKTINPENLIEITPKGSIEIKLGAFYNNNQNPIINETNRRQAGPVFDMNIQANVVGNIGNMMKINFNYDTKSNFNVDRQLMNLAWSGKEDQILKKIEAGNITLPTKSALITGSSKLMGIKTELQFGRLTVTSAWSQLQGNKSSIRLEGGAQKKEFEIEALDYEYNKHFFLGHYFREHYEDALRELPIIQSDARVTRIEVWVTNTTRQPTNSRDIIALMDLGENRRARNTLLRMDTIGSGFPDAEIEGGYLDNQTSNLYDYVTDYRNRNALNTLEANDIDLTNIRDYQITNARLLNPNEYFYDTLLGYITVNRRLNADEVLAVAYEYSVNVNGEVKVFKVGEFANEQPGQAGSTPPTLITKMLKSSRLDPKYPMWDLMMKNIYSLNAYQVSKEDFFLNIFYQDPGGGAKRYIDEGEIDGMPLIQVLNLDNLNDYNQKFPNGFFDFVEGRTIIAQRGRLIFPILEPFAGQKYRSNGNNISGIRTKFGNDPNNYGDKYAFDELYDSTNVIAAQFPEFNRFTIAGTYSSNVSSDISLGRMQIPQGSVIVTAGGAPLTEGVDYTVDYMMGRVKILRQDILNSGTPIDISFESSDLFGVSNKALYAHRFDYWINDNFTLGATWMKIAERPFQQKAQFGNEPIKNSIYGFDAKYYTELPGLTKFLDNLPIISTKEKSSISVSGEYAELIPSHPKIIGGVTGEGSSDLDNFEGAKIEYSIGDQFTRWGLASTPTGEAEYTAASSSNNLDYGKDRALFNWRSVDQIFSNQNTQRFPDHLRNTDLGYYGRTVTQTEIWPDRQLATINNMQRTFDLSFYPSVRGPYNYDAEDLLPDGSLANPESRWGGIMQYLPVTDFEAMNFELIEFWLLDPFYVEGDSGNTVQEVEGELVFNLGDISEDVLKDGNIQYENGLASMTDIDPILNESVWGKTPATPPINLAFDNDPDSRIMQDVGLDGLGDSLEREYFKNFLDAIEANTTLTAEAKQKLEGDPSSDNFEYFLSENHDNNQHSILERYLNFNGLEGNSPIADGSDNSFVQRPSTEDLNNNNTLDDAENYYEYRIPIKEDEFQVGKNYIVSKTENNIDGKTVTWYQFQIPVRSYDRRIGNINGFRSIRYMRMYVKGFSSPVHLRFGTLALVRNQWRKYDKSLFEGEDLLGIGSDNIDNKNFNVSSVSLFEHGSKSPVNYIMPPGIQQERMLSQLNTQIQQDERAMSMNVCNLIDGDARAVFKNMEWDVRNYKRIKAHIHAEEPDTLFSNLKDNDLVFFIRFGMDNTFNYYEYQMPLKLTPHGTYDGNSGIDARAVWDSIDVELSKFVQLKMNRNESNFNPSFIYTEVDQISSGNTRYLSVKGNPDLSRIKSFLIGVRNPSQGHPQNPSQEDDGLEKCAEIWVNELKLVGFDEEGGAAALAMMEIKMADLANVVFSGQMHQQGFGAIDASIADRYLDDYYTYTLSSQVNLHKFLPKAINVNLPFYASTTKQVSTPRYDPQQGDVRLSDKLQAMKDGGASLTELVQARDEASTVETNTSYNFTNVKVNKSNRTQKSHLYDLSNFSLTYRFVENNKSNPFIEVNSRSTQQGIVNYNYTNTPKNYKPFNKVIPRKNKLLKPIRTINYTLLPSNLSMSSNMNRQIGTVRLRSFSDEELPNYFNKRFDWNRTYTYKHKPTKALDFAFNAATNSFLDEDRNAETPQEVRQSIISGIRDTLFGDRATLGVITNYNHNANLSYKVPFKVLPYLSWVNVNTKLNTNYNWNGENLVLPQLGNNINNGYNFSINANLKSRTLYKEMKNLYKDVDKLFEKKEKDDKDKKSKSKSKSKKKKKKGMSKSEKIIKKTITGIKTTSFNYTQKKSTVLPGFMPNPLILGQTASPLIFQSTPGMDFAFGYQPFLIQDTTRSAWLDNLTKGEGNDIFSTDPLLRQVIWTENENMSGRLGIEWIKSLRVDLNWQRDFNSSSSGYFVNLVDSNQTYNDNYNKNYELSNHFSQGEFKYTSINIRTAFTGKALDKDFDNYNRFSDSTTRTNILAAIKNLSGNEHMENYSILNQSILVPAFISAYHSKQDFTNDDLRLIDPDNFRTVIPAPNWKVNYTGLAKLKPLKKHFKNIKLEHKYSSTNTFNNFQSNLQFEVTPVEELADTNLERDIIGQVNLDEKFAPLLGITTTMKNGLNFKMKYAKSRRVNLSFATLNINEQKSQETTFEIGYQLKPGILIPFTNYTTVKPIKISFNYSIKDNITTLYTISSNDFTHTGGMKETKIGCRADYQMDKHINLNFNFNWKTTKPYTTNNYPITNMTVDVTMRYTL